MPAISKAISDFGVRVEEGLNRLDVTLYEQISNEEAGGVRRPLDVNFYDWDGRLVRTFTAKNFLKLNSMPPNPTREGYISRGWNWSLADAKGYVKKYGALEIGQMYNPDPNYWGTNTKITIEIPEGGRLTIPLMWQQSISEGIRINWGDGSETEVVEGTGVVESEHTYATEGEYTIVMSAEDDDVVLDFGDGVNSKNVFGESTTKKYSTYLKKVIVGNFVTNIGDYAFNTCYALESLTISDSVMSIGERAFSGCYALTTLTMPNSITSIGNRAFSSCNTLTSLSIPDSVTSIGDYAFSGGFALTSLTIPDSVTSIGQYALNGGFALTSLTIPDSVTSIGDYTFYSCYALTTLIIPDSVTSIGQSAFSNCYALTSLTIPDSVTSIGQNAFSGCYAITSLTIPDSVTSIGQQAFSNCQALTLLTIPDSVTSIGQQAFAACYPLTTLIIPDSVTSIEKYVFSNCYALTSLTIPDSVTSIGQNAFASCYALTTLTIPDSVTSIGNNAFNNCYTLTTLTLLPENPPTLSNVNAFSNIPTDYVIYVPYSEDHSILDAYKTATNWSTYADQMVEMDPPEESEEQTEGE